MVEEILLTFITGSVGLLAVPFQLLFGFRGFTPDVLPKLIDSDATFVVVFFDVLSGRPETLRQRPAVTVPASSPSHTAGARKTTATSES